MTGTYQRVSLVLSLFSVVLTMSLSFTGRKRRTEVYVSLRGVDVMAQTLIHGWIAYMNSVDCASLLSDPYVPYVLALRWVVFCVSQNQMREWGHWVEKPVSKALKRVKENEGPVALILVISSMVCYHKNVLTTERSLAGVAVAVAMVWPVLQVVTVNLKFRARIHCSLHGQTSHDVVAVLVPPCFFVKVGGDMLFVMLGGMYIIFVMRSMLSLWHGASVTLCMALGLSFWLVLTNLLWKQMGMFLRIITHPCRLAAGNTTKQALCEIVSDTLLYSPAVLDFWCRVLACGAQHRSPSLPTLNLAKMNESLALASKFSGAGESRVLQDMTIAIGFDSLSSNFRVNLYCLSTLLGGCPMWNGLLRRTSLTIIDVVGAVENSVVQLCGGLGDDALALYIVKHKSVQLYIQKALTGLDETDRMEAAEAISLGSTFLKKLVAKNRVKFKVQVPIKKSKIE